MQLSEDFSGFSFSFFSLPVPLCAAICAVEVVFLSYFRVERDPTLFHVHVMPTLRGPDALASSRFSVMPVIEIHG